ncbi:related to NAD-dependent deacetylase Sirtuin 5 [Sporisorium reilianum f. sp. reilianum]|uniref:Related to NAD-dependent deacetylase Sirtuin 5 n=1 Tax=Sporisorium reilianum f. sp. reilianum TaxID=72559 RepID=A0A2N8UL37_9BASI|nr:related to NAD-dependent deacetylase Sirtuin 5 [Sporisorium reilianum f. sp. reilianum]
MGAAAESFRQALRQARHPVALAGAGLSAASGIPTFRGAGGLWRQHDALSLATPEAFRRDASKVWQFYHYRRSVVLSAAPNAAHVSLARLLLEPAVRSRVMPDAQSFHLVTQNVDGLSGRALHEMNPPQGSAAVEAARNSIIEMHGNLFKTICTSCGDSRIDTRQPLSEGLRGTEDLSGEYRAIAKEQLPRCTAAGCGDLLRPGIVWFGESIPDLDRIQPLISRCDLILVLGTSSTVYPAAGFADMVKHSNGGRVAVFNIDDPCAADADDDVDWYFAGRVEKMLPDVLGL